jgi:hypothetical protein
MKVCLHLVDDQEKSLIQRSIERLANSSSYP